jgi:hypothetical protein
MLESVTEYSENHTELMNTLRWQNSQFFFSVEISDTCSNLSILKLLTVDDELKLV